MIQSNLKQSYRSACSFHIGLHNINKGDDINMDIFSMFSLLSLLKDFKTSKQPRAPSRLKQEIYELSSELDYFMNKFNNFGRRD